MERRKGNSHDDAGNYLGAYSSPVRNQRRFGKDTTERNGHEDHLPVCQHVPAVHHGDVTMKTKYEVRLPVRLGPEWDFSLWFALLSPLIGILLGILGVFLLYH